MKPADTTSLPGDRGHENPIVLTMGDPAGIGPEIIVRTFQERPELLRQVVVAGDVPSLQRALAWTAANNNAGLRLVQIGDLSTFSQVPSGCMAVVQACELPQPVVLGRIDAEAGRAAADCIRFAAQAALNGQARAVVTAPIHKEALAAAGVAHPGHTEFLQALAAGHRGVSVAELPVRMMLSCPGLRTVLVSIHVSLRQAIDAVTEAQVLQTLRITAPISSAACPRHASRWRVEPHAGEWPVWP
jgi:4-hydroxythreonine-4-phosphate dehydrogenase